MAKKVRIKDIASKLGLSSTLVSLVLNNKASQHGIKAETQERVIAAAHSMGYFEGGAISIKTESVSYNPGIIGMVVTSLNDPFIVQLSEYLRKAFAGIGHGFSIITLDSSDLRYGKFTTSLKRMYNGVVLAGDSVDDEIVRSLKASHFPYVLLEKADINLRLNEVRSDCVAGGVKLAGHLSELGYKRFTIISNSVQSPYSNEKISCCIQSLKELIPDSEIHECVVESGITSSINDEDLIPFISKPISTQLLIVSEVDLVYSVFQSLERLKIRVPADLAIVSLEDGPAFDLISTPVTSLKRDISGISSKVVSMLWSEIKNKGKGKYKRSVHLAPELIVRKSCGKL